MVEDVATAEVDEDPRPARAQQVDVDGVDETSDVPPEVHGPESNERFSRRATVPRGVRSGPEAFPRHRIAGYLGDRPDTSSSELDHDERRDVERSVGECCCGSDVGGDDLATACLQRD